MGAELLLYLGGLALLDTLSPAIIGVTLYLLLTDSQNVTARLFALVFTVFILYFSLGLAMMLGLTYIMDTFSSLFQNKLFSWIVFVIGMILFVASFFITTNKKSAIPIPRTHSIASMVMIGLLTFLIEASTALPYFAAIGLFITNDMPMIQWLPLLAAYNMMMILPAIILFLGNKLFKKWVTPILVNLHNKLSSSSSSVLSWVMCIVGLILIVNTLDYL